jgi:peptidoglycan/LPS O-acetylase OafA/YrhL
MPQDLIVNDVGPITVGPVMMFSFVPALFAGVLLAVLARFSRRPVRIFLALAAVVFVLMLFPPFSIAGAPLGMILALELMHVVAAVTIVGIILRFARH